MNLGISLTDLVANSQSKIELLTASPKVRLKIINFLSFNFAGEWIL